MKYYDRSSHYPAAKTTSAVTVSIMEHKKRFAFGPLGMLIKPHGFLLAKYICISVITQYSLFDNLPIQMC